VIVVSNTSPIINLAAIDQLHLLYELYETIYIPQAAFQEITVTGAGLPGAEQVKDFEWIIKKNVDDQKFVKALQMDLDKGEAEAIALALEIEADLLLIDEKIGRSMASDFGLKFVGLLGILIEAKSKGLIKNIKTTIDKLKNKAGFWISDELYNFILDSVGETNND
jgi:uncharacterized protein